MSSKISHLFATSDHRVIGLRYWWLSLIAVLLGVALSLLMRVQLAYPDTNLSWLEWAFPAGIVGGVMLPEFYLSLVTMHGTIMVFFVLTTAPQAGFGNLLLPTQIGAPEMAYPRRTHGAWWLTVLAFLVLFLAFFVEGGAPQSGWTAYPPLSALGDIVGPGQGGGMTLWIVSIALFCIAAILSASNFLVTTMNQRAADMPLFSMPLPSWSWFVTALLSLLAFPVLLAAGLLLLMDRHLGTSFFVPTGVMVGDQLLDHRGGSPILWQHLFWYFGHPEVYIAILPGMGVVSQVLSTFAGKPVFGYRAMVYAMLAIGLLGFFVWGHHMFLSGISPYSAIAFSLVTLTVGVPSALKTFNWLGTLWGGRIRFTTPMLFAIGFVSLFITGGLTGIFLGQTSLDVYLHDTYFVVGHFHIIMGVAAVFGLFAATYYWFPVMYGRQLNEGLGKWHFVLTFVGVHLIFLPMLTMGIIGAPRRYFDFSQYEFLSTVASWNRHITWAAAMTAVAQVLFLWNVIRHRWTGRAAPPDPWSASGREWQPAATGEVRSTADSRHLTPALARRFRVAVDSVPQLMLLGALLSALLFRRGYGTDWGGVEMPVYHWAAVGVLAASSLVLRSLGSVRLTLVLGLLFLADLAFTWQFLWADGARLADSAHVAFYHLLTGLVALFVLAAGRQLLRRNPADATAAEAGWHVAAGLGVIVLLFLGVS